MRAVPADKKRIKERIGNDGWKGAVEWDFWS
jgi:hypothetical protein